MDGSQINSLTIVCSTVYSDADQRKHQSSATLAFVRGIPRWPVNSPHKWPVTRKMFPFDDVIMNRNYISRQQTYSSWTWRISSNNHVSRLIRPKAQCTQRGKWPQAKLEITQYPVWLTEFTWYGDMGKNATFCRLQFIVHGLNVMLVYLVSLWNQGPWMMWESKAFEALADWNRLCWISDGSCLL